MKKKKGNQGDEGSRQDKVNEMNEKEGLQDGSDTCYYVWSGDCCTNKKMEFGCGVEGIQILMMSTPVVQVRLSRLETKLEI